MIMTGEKLKELKKKPVSSHLSHYKIHMDWSGEKKTQASVVRICDQQPKPWHGH